MAEGMKDFLGQEYGPGDLVIYGAMSGRSVNMVIGRVEEVYDVFRSHETYRWVRLKPGQLAPFKTRYGWFVDGVLIEGRPEPGTPNCAHREYQTDEREETVTKVKIQPLRAARWTQHHGHDFYVDTRSGRRIDPYAHNGEHIASGGYVEDTRTGEPVPEHIPHYDPRYVPYEYRRWVRVVFQPWVEKGHDAPKAVTIEITENIVKWNGELPEEEN